MFEISIIPLQYLSNDASSQSDSLLTTFIRDSLLHQIHPLISAGRPANPIRHAAHAHLCQHYFDHRIHHCGHVTDAQCLLHHSVWNKLVRMLNQGEEVLTFGTDDECVVHE